MKKLLQLTIEMVGAYGFWLYAELNENGEVSNA